MLDKSKLRTDAKALELKHIDYGKLHLFKEKFNQWVHSSIQVVKGLPEKYYIVSGVTDALNQTYGLYNRIGVFVGEYGYHSLVLGDRVTTDLEKCDVIVISHPFSADGLCSHKRLKIADTYNKPIFVDCAFFGACYDIDFDFSQYKNIHSVCFSLSKSYGTGHNRVGLLYTKDRYPVTVQSEWHYEFVSSATYHYDLIDTKTPDTMPERYKRMQHYICEQLELLPSKTILFGLDHSDRYQKFNRGYVNRVCITDLY
jgi:hypothetical protein